ncbi:hypothetical protein AWJ20_1979 [Sugiyamaella lignohabitans]|uniref:Monopolin complex subunit Csm1/Pcs1 C-terminal domain-containing protein n=1 Tax=Sugiyamaella lignohabitans TaxID=796027 RepID=A0A167ERN1_9ASCO|nr:uncharacterized protein AWJ20_1979 [Sugiyamaella lignohabitans]ANB14391.1 hypothetical protein AWJ20_1979 [Sugiyamaella lignohabitans]
MPPRRKRGAATKEVTNGDSSPRTTRASAAKKAKETTTDSKPKRSSSPQNSELASTVEPKVKSKGKNTKQPVVEPSEEEDEAISHTPNQEEPEENKENENVGIKSKLKKVQSPPRNGLLTSALGISLENTPVTRSNKRQHDGEDTDDSPSIVSRSKKHKNSILSNGEANTSLSTLSQPPKKAVKKPWRTGTATAANSAETASKEGGPTGTIDEDTSSKSKPNTTEKPLLKDKSSNPHIISKVTNGISATTVKSSTVTKTDKVALSNPRLISNSSVTGLISPSKPAHPGNLASSISSHGRLSPTKSHPRVAVGLSPSKHGASDSTLSSALTSFTVNAASELAVKFEKLRDLRETKAEELLNEFKLAAEARFQASDELIRELRLHEEKNQHSQDQELVDANIALQNLQQNVANLNSDLEAANEEISLLKAKLEAKENQQSQNMSNLALGICSDLSGLVILKVLNEEDEYTYECVQSGRNGVFRYNLSVAKSDSKEESHDITFTPLLTEKDEHLTSLLPDYFTEPLSFTREAVSILWC